MQPTKLNKNSWHVGVYLWWRREKGYSGLPPTVNLCPYVRTVLFWAPLRWMFLSGKKSWVFWGGLIALLHFVGYRFLGVKFFRVDTVLGSLAAGVLLTALTLWFGSRVRRGMRRSETLQSFGSALAARWGAAHNRVCPILELVDDEPNSPVS